MHETEIYNFFLVRAKDSSMKNQSREQSLKSYFCCEITSVYSLFHYILALGGASGGSHIGFELEDLLK